MTDGSKRPRCSAAPFEQFQSDPHAIVRWASGASPREFGALAPLVIEQARAGDMVAIAILRAAAAHVDALAARLMALGVERIALVGRGWPSTCNRGCRTAPGRGLVPAAGDALDGALQLARAAAESAAA